MLVVSMVALSHSAIVLNNVISVMFALGRKGHRCGNPIDINQGSLIVQYKEKLNMRACSTHIHAKTKVKQKKFLGPTPKGGRKCST